MAAQIAGYKNNLGAALAGVAERKFLHRPEFGRPRGCSCPQCGARLFTLHLQDKSAYSRPAYPGRTRKRSRCWSASHAESVPPWVAASLDVSTKAFGGDLAGSSAANCWIRHWARRLSRNVYEFGGPISTRLGYHILQVVGRAERPIEAGRLPNIAENIFQLWLEAQVEGADIRLNLEALNAIAESRSQPVE